MRNENLTPFLISYTASALFLVLKKLFISVRQNPLVQFKNTSKLDFTIQVFFPIIVNCYFQHFFLPLCFIYAYRHHFTCCKYITWGNYFNINHFNFLPFNSWLKKIQVYISLMYLKIFPVFHSMFLISIPASYYKSFGLEEVRS